ncbi:histidine kinase [Amycolatopsis sp. K13G38]|uniref:Histidine kinase n=1 Tax=Amycolatopsis acididurans TaxID=2724524 RepID=A0ABX1J4N7_9PSEU|nr:histidine kinase [Amycolatopsis acididurans]NKQ54756.1 histidine kinase [Amycolatopsis acididurans]
MGLADNPQMEDYSLRYTPAAFRKWSPWMVFLSCLVGISAMAGYALDAAFVDEFGFANSLIGFGVAAAVTLPLTLVIAFAIARKHVDIDLLTRGSGFGYLGSTLTSLVYATYTLIFLAYEGAIMAQAVTALTHVDIHISYVVVSAVMIPLTLYGMSFSAKFQAWTWPIWVALIGLALGTAATAPDAGQNMVHPATVSPTGLAGLTVLAVFTIAAAQLSLATQVGEQGDYLRLMPDPHGGNRGRWRLAVIMGGPGFALFAVGIFFASTLLVGYASTKTGADHVGVPVDLFTVVYERLTGNHTVALILAGLLVLLSQIKINIMNTYSGSLSWSNFFSRLLHRHPGRAAWVFLQVGLSLVLMEIDIFSHIVEVLAWYSNVGVAWIAAMVSDLVINKRWLKLAPPNLVFHRAHLYNVNPVGFGSMIVAGAVSMIAYYGAFGPTAAALSPFIALVVAVVLPPVVAFATKGRWYIARTSELPANDGELPCSACGGDYDVADMATCPFHGGTVCSLCCSTEGACKDACKPSAWRPPKGAVPLGMPGFTPEKELEVA